MGELAHILVHAATPVRYTEGGSDTPADQWIEGEPGADGPEPIKGEPFACVLFLPLGAEESPGADSPRPRKSSRPTIMYETPRADGTAVVLSADDELLIAAPELSAHFEQAEGEAAGVGRWQVDGRPQPFGPPGEVIGVQANVKQVTD